MGFIIPCFLVMCVSSGIGYFISTIAPPQHCPFIAAIVCFVSCGLLGHPMKVHRMQQTYALEVVMDLASITRWSVGMAFISGLDEIQPVATSLRKVEEINVMKKTYLNKPIMQDQIGYWYTAMAFLLGMAITFRCAAYLAL